MLDVLIIGGDGQIGQRLAARMREKKFDVVATTRKWPPADGMLPFDLRYPSFLPYAVYTYICTGITGFKPCEADPAEAHRINVELTVATAARIKSHIIFLSSSAVETHPDTVYGITKRDAEAGILALGGMCLRFGPVAFPGRDVYPNDIYSPINLSTLMDHCMKVHPFRPGLHKLYNRDWVKEAA